MGRDFSHHRKYETRTQRKVLYIYSEGKVTEIKYFASIRRELRLSGVNIELVGTGRGTIALVDQVIKQCDTKDDLVECWVVFDRDQFTRYNQAIEKARANNINVAFSNEAFELWFILHFEYLQSPLGTDRFRDKLTKLIGQEYKKDMDMYSIIKNMEPEAISNAKKLEQMHDEAGTKSYQDRVPSTTVYQLIERLRNIEN